MFAVTWCKYCSPNMVFAEKRWRTTTCKKIVCPHLARYGHSYEESSVTMLTYHGCIVLLVGGKHSRFWHSNALTFQITKEILAQKGLSGALKDLTASGNQAALILSAKAKETPGNMQLSRLVDMKQKGIETKPRNPSHHKPHKHQICLLGS